MKNVLGGCWYGVVDVVWTDKKNTGETLTNHTGRSIIHKQKKHVFVSCFFPVFAYFRAIDLLPLHSFYPYGHTLSKKYIIHCKYTHKTNGHKYRHKYCTMRNTYKIQWVLRIPYVSQNKAIINHEFANCPMEKHKTTDLIPPKVDGHKDWLKKPTRKGSWAEERGKMHVQNKVLARWHAFAYC